MDTENRTEDHNNTSRNRNDDNNTSKQVLLSVLGVAILIVAVVGISFAAFTYSKAGSTVNTISTGTVTMSYTSANNGINIENAEPITEAQGKVLTGENQTFDFTVTANIKGNTNIDYEVVAVKSDTSGTGTTIPTPTNPIPDENIRLYLEESSDGTSNYTEVLAPTAFSPTTSTVGAPAGTMRLVSGTFTGNTDGTAVEIKKYYRLRMWVDTSYNVSGTPGEYYVRVDVYGKGRD